MGSVLLDPRHSVAGTLVGLGTLQRPGLLLALACLQTRTFSLKVYRSQQGYKQELKCIEAHEVNRKSPNLGVL